MDDITKTLRDARKSKMADEALDLMNKFLKQMNHTDEKMAMKDYIDILGVWSQVIGGTLATLGGAEKDSWKSFLPHIEQNIEVAFEAKRLFEEGRKG